jgi:hypothetical protein
MTEVIALSGRIGVGKSYAAAHLQKQGFTLVKFAGPLKDMMRALGLNEREIEGDLKEEPCDLLCGRTPRLAMQTLGTEWGRNLIAQGLWVEIWKARARKHECVVVDDCRFANEAAAVRALGGLVIRLRSKGDGAAALHSSEDIQLAADATVYNDYHHGFLEQLDKVLLALRTGEKL